ncbi:MAG TPA: TonB-dependent receptor [Steroidobacteraceae bacterium]|jgi:TonB-dependent receptor|nr:TonB-dependent receptor [Steroidobacteraceae bacterium]
MRAKKYLPVYGTAALAIFTGMTATAQEKPKEDAEQIAEVVVTGVRQSMRDSVIMKQNSALITDNIASGDIGQLPDVTIAEELNRLPGVNATRDRGNASQAAIRGLGPRLVFGTVNGREVASSEPSQDLRWEIYPSEVLAGVQVYKSQDATLIPGGIAGTVDIRTLSPLDYEGSRFSFRGGPTYNEGASDLPHYDPLGFRGSAGFVGHINDDLAVSIAVSAQNEKNGFPDFRTFGWNTPDNAGAGNTGDLNGDGTPDNTTWGLVTELKEVVQDRHAIAGAVGWRPGENLKIKFDALYSQYKINEDQFQAWYGNNITGNWANGNSATYNAPGNSYEIVDGSVVAADLNNAFPNYQSSINNYNEKHTLLVTGLNAEWTAGSWVNTFDLSYSQAKRNNRWEAIYLADVFAPSLTFDIREGQTPFASMGTFNPANPAIQSAVAGRNGQSDGPEETRDSIGAFAADFSRDFEGATLSNIKFGVRASTREKKHQRFRYDLCAGTGSAQNGVCRAGTGTVDLSNAGLESFTVPGFTAPPMVWGDFDRVRALVYPDDSVPAGSEQLLVHTTVKETTYDGYAKATFEGHLLGKDLTTGFGVRVANLKSTSSGYQSLGGVISPVSIDNSTTEILPSLNMSLHVADDQVLRFGAAVALSRPPLDALVTGFSLNPATTPGTPSTGGGGNPLLEPYKANQFDLSYEWYFHDESMFAAAVYYKDLKTLIGAGQETQTIDGQQYIVTSEQNGPGGGIKGLELTYQTRFHFLPGFLSDFGMYANYAYADSDVHEFAPAANPFLIVGLAKTTSQLDLFYNKGGFEVRGAWKHHSPFTVAPGWVGTVLKQLGEEDLYDASVSYSWNDRYSLRLQGHNLSDERGLQLSDNMPQNLAGDGGYQVYGRSYLLDFGIKF